MLDFRALERDGEEGLKALVAEGRPESLTLDYKIGNGTQPIFAPNGALTREGRKVFGKAISAFANAVGGVVIVGIDCSNQNGVDEPSKLVPLPNIRACRTAIANAISELVQPAHDGIEIQCVYSEADDTEGYLLILIPKGSRRPYRSEADHRYYRRNGTSSIPMEHYEVEDAFHGVDGPIMQLHHRVVGGRLYRGRAAAYIQLMLQNVGGTTATDVVLIDEGQNGINYQYLSTENSNGLNVHQTLLFDTTQVLLKPKQSLTLHPGQFALFEEMVILVESNPPQIGYYPLEMGLPYLGMRFAAYANGLPRQELWFNLSDDVVEKLTSMLDGSKYREASDHEIDHMQAVEALWDGPPDTYPPASWINQQLEMRNAPFRTASVHGQVVLRPIF